MLEAAEPRHYNPDSMLCCPRLALMPGAWHAICCL